MSNGTTTRRKHRPERRSALASLIVVLLLLTGLGAAWATSDTTTTTDPSATETTTAPGATSTESAGITTGGGGGGNINNEVVVINTNDGRFANRSRTGVARVTGDTAGNQNAAAATSSCNDCRTVAVAIQVVLIQRTDASEISPRNLAIALNVNCLRCETFAAAYQYVVTTNGLVRFTPEGNRQLAALDAQVRALAATDGVPFPELEAQIDAVVEQMWAVVDNELAMVGEPGGSPFKDTDEAIDGDATPSLAASASESPAPEPSLTPTATTEPEATTSPSPEQSSTPAPEPSPSQSSP